MIKFSRSRTYTIPYEDKEGEISFSITFKFPDPKEYAGKEITVMDILMNSMVNSSGFIDSDTDLEFFPDSDENKAIIGQIIKLLPDYLETVVLAMLGPTGKNYLAGVMQLSIGDGNLKDVDHASKESVKKD